MTATILTHELDTVARRLTSGGRGILAADESIATMSQRLEAVGIAASETTRRDYREWLLLTPGLADHVAGVIWCDETFGQRLSDDRPFPEAAHALGVLPGIKVDTGTVPLGADGSLVTEGLDGLGARLADYAERGAAFAKWRAVFDVQTTTPYGIGANAQALARYASLCQAHGIVPIVEPEVLATGDHDLVQCAQVTRKVLAGVFTVLEEAGVALSGIVLKPNFVTPGHDCQRVSSRTAATVTYDVLRDTVPADVPGIAFLSGGHPTERACEYLRELSSIEGAPWDFTFSFGRALVSEALATWGGEPDSVADAQAVLLASCAQAASATQ